ncbi:type II/IV secretion system ATPase subunit [Candidatus Woesearchaeota archaeon]|nr:type II/IV secretion system ATPase subunit [Candidatus Woesearchaeota archaeon]
MAFNMFKKKNGDAGQQPAESPDQLNAEVAAGEKTVITAPAKSAGPNIIFEDGKVATAADEEAFKPKMNDIAKKAEEMAVKMGVPEEKIDVKTDGRTILGASHMHISGQHPGEGGVEADEPAGGAAAAPAAPVEAAKPEKPAGKETDAGADSESGTVRVGSEEGFYIDLRPKVIQLPPYEQRRTINVRYPLIPPYAYAHIYWDKQENELLYKVEEPILDDTEKELLELINLGLEEMINISFVRAAKSNILLQYLEKNVQSILIELGTKVSKKTYNKLLYYVYRNSVGMNEIEPLLNDYYVEDIECNGLKFPLYIVHRKYQNLKTNVQFDDASYMTDFIEKLAQKTGRYISYAKPLLDGTLPDGSRVNATYTEDITTRGPTFTIRKFTKEPWTPIHLIQSKTVTAEAFAYMWMIIENKFNIMVVGETASGKTTFLNCIVDFIPPEARICSIEDTRELNLAHINWLPAVTRAGFGMPTVLGTQYGEITLFDLLRESLRQAPDYVIVGEIRGQEAYVLFQGMASGHPSFSTFHAASVDTVVKRLETPPINLSPSLVEALDVICICIHVKDANRNFRRLKEIDEIQEIEQALGRAKYNAVFEWDPAKDVISYNQKPQIFDRISKRTGLTIAQIGAEMKRRATLLNMLAQKNINSFQEFNKIVNDYYKDADTVCKKFGIK